MMPIFGLASRIHDTVKRIAGMTRGMSDNAKNSDLKGVLVRSLIQAKKVPITKATADDPAAEHDGIAEQAQGLRAQIGSACSSPT